MAENQTRRSISFSSALHARIAYEAQQDGLTLSHWVETVVRAELERRGRPLLAKAAHMSREQALRARDSRARNRSARREAGERDSGADGSS